MPGKPELSRRGNSHLRLRGGVVGAIGYLMMIRKSNIRFSAFTLSAMLLIAPLLGACGGGSPTRLPAATPTAGFTLDTVASGLQVPWALDFAPDGRIFVTERPGTIRVIEDGELLPEPWAVLEVAQRSEMGLMGIAIAPDFAESRHVYVVGSFEVAGGGIENRVLRFTERGQRGEDPQLVLGGLPAARYHAGAALGFGPDGMLYLTVGDATRPGDSQDLESLAGKILRLRPDGGVPADNPIPGSLVYALGIRNSQGIDWHPETGDLFASDHGPSGLPRERFRRHRDELNLIRPGGNYGWPEASGMQEGDSFILPLVEWTPAIAPGGIAFYTGSDFPWRQSVFVAALRGEQLLRVELERARGATGGWRAVGSESLMEGELGRIRAVKMGSDGFLYLTTSNRDGRGDAAPRDDLLLRIVPAPEGAGP
jgi:aldose sugar dehydrogenase